MSNEPKASLVTSIVTMWVLLEGDPSPVEVDVNTSEYSSGRLTLNRLKSILKNTNEFSDVLQDVRPTKIEFFNNDDRTEPLKSGMILTEDTTTDENPLVVRYPLSDSSIVATYKFGHSKERYEMPHSSGSFSLLREDVIKNFKRLSKFEDTQAHELYFEIDKEMVKIENEFQFNSLVKRTEEKNGMRLLPEFKVLIKGKKPYGDWEIKEVFAEILHQEFASLNELQTFNLDELPEHTPLTDDELKFFVGIIQQTLDAFKNAVNVNEATSREYISIFMKTAVKHIQIFTNNSAQLFIENNLNGSRGYGPVDYLVKLNAIAVLVNEAKMENILKGIAQAIMQLHSMKEKLGKRKLDQTGFDSSSAIFGIVTTGSSWHFIRWTGSVENPKVEISKQYLCDFTGDMQSAKDVVSYIVRMLQMKDNEFKNTSKRPCTEKSKDVIV